MVIVSDYKTYRKLPNSPFNWKQITHAQCGGATAYSTIIATSDINFAVKYSPLQQKLLHFLDHCIQPDSLLIPKHHIKAEGLLSIRHLSLPIFYQTQYTASECGEQQLTSLELEKMWNISYPLSFTAPLLILANILHAAPTSVNYSGLSNGCNDDKKFNNSCIGSSRGFFT